MIRYYSSLTTRMKTSLISCVVLAASMTMGHQSAAAQWQNITEEARKIAGEEPRQSPIYIRMDSIRNIKSVEFKDTIYRRADFSFSDYGSTRRKRYVFECRDWSYRTEDTSFIRNWITPATETTSIDWIAYKYLCPRDSSPWIELARASDETIYYINKETVYNFNRPDYGRVAAAIISSVRKFSSEVLYLYASCSRQMIAVYEIGMDPGDEYIKLEEVNPSSIGEGLLRQMC